MRKHRLCPHLPVPLFLVTACLLWLQHDAAAQIRNAGGGNVQLLPAPGAPNVPQGRIPGAGLGKITTLEHPLFTTSYIGESDRVIAQTRYGPVTARDLYLWLTIRDHPMPYVLESYDKARTQSEKETLARSLRKEIDEFVFTNYSIPEMMGAAPCDAVSGLREQLRLLPAYQLVYILRVILPQICIEQADRVNFLQEHKALFESPERFRVRYIKLKSSFNDPLIEQDRVEARIVDLRRQLAQKQITFADAARKHSQAPSAENGGEVPPIRRGELFYFFDEAVGNLTEAGEVSPPFRGPDGSYYLVQLLEKLAPGKPDLNDPRVACRVDDMLWRKVLRAQYEYEIRQLFEKHYLGLLVSDWDRRDDTDLVAFSGPFGLSKGQVRNILPDLERENLTRQSDLITKVLSPITEREAMAHVVREGGWDCDPLLQRARWMAGNMTRRDAYAELCECRLNLSADIVQAFWRRNPSLFTPMPLQRIFRVSLAPVESGPVAVGPAPTGLVAELARILDLVAKGESPTAMPAAADISGESLIDSILSRGDASAMELFGDQDIFGTTSGKTLEPIELSPDIEPLDTTGTLDLPVPSLDDEGDGTGDGDATMSLPGESLSTATGTISPLVSLDVLDKPSTTALENRGGAAPDSPAAGGGRIAVPSGSASRVASRPTGRAAAPEAASFDRPGDPSEKRPSMALTEDLQPIDVADVPNTEAVFNPCCPPVRVPPLYGNSLCDFLPEYAPAVPCPQAIPFNPDIRYAKLSSRGLSALFRTYSNPGLKVQVQDLGYLYAVDNAQIPKGTEALEAGTFTYPTKAGNGAASYYVAGVKRAPRPSFEKIQGQVYFTYRKLKVMKCVEAAVKKSRSDARIVYTFGKEPLSSEQVPETSETSESEE